MTDPSVGDRLLEALDYQPPASYLWTRDQVTAPLRSADIEALAADVNAGVAERKLVLPNSENLVRRCIVALLGGHLVLQGPPGTGKTTLARLLADAFGARLEVATATSDWSPYDVVGGLRPGSGGKLVPGLGCVTEAALACAEAVRDDPRDGSVGQAVWLLVDELNRADIDKAIGGLYTVLSSVNASHLIEAPVELWFGEGDAERMWVPSRFRIIGTMNDVDTSFVNALSQGLVRRFQFLYVGVPSEDNTGTEVRQAMLQARDWLAAQYPTLTVPNEEGLIAATETIRGRLVSVVKGLRWHDAVPGWPLGTAQLVDVWRTVLLQAPAGEGEHLDRVLDEAISDRVVPQMSTLDKEQLDAFGELLRSSDPSMDVSAAAVAHLVNPHTTL